MSCAQELLQAGSDLKRTESPVEGKHNDKSGLPAQGSVHSYVKPCRYCGVEIKMKRLTTKGWLPFESAGEHHVCAERRLSPKANKHFTVAPHLEPSDPLLECIDKQLAERKFACVLCSAPVCSSLEKDGLFLRCTYCKRKHEISNETLNYTLQRLKVRCGKCGALAVTRNHVAASAVGCSRFPQCSRIDSWDHVRGVLSGRRLPEATQHVAGSPVATEYGTQSQPKSREPVAHLLEKRTELIWEKVRSDRVQNHGFRVSVEIDESLVDPVISVTILSRDVVPTSLSTGRRPVMFFEREDDASTISSRLQPWFRI